MTYVQDGTPLVEGASQRRNRRRRKAAANPKPAPTRTPGGASGAASAFGYNPSGDPTQPPAFHPFPQQYSTNERNAARKLATSRVDALLAALPTEQSITGRYGAQSAAAGGMAKSLSDYLSNSQIARVGFAGSAPNIFSQTVASAAAPAAAVIGPQTAQPGTGLIAAMAANTANSLAGAPGAAVAQGNIVQGGIGRQQTQALNDRAQQATSLRLKLPELEQAAMADNRDAAYKAWAANENGWLARAQMAQQGNQFNAREANDAAAAAAGNAQDTWQAQYGEANQNARTQAQIDAANTRAAAKNAADANKDGKVSAREQAKVRQKLISDALKNVEKLRGQRTPASQWVYTETGHYNDDPKTPNVDESKQTFTDIHRMDTPMQTLPAGWTLDTPGSYGGQQYTSQNLFDRAVRELVAKGISRKRAENVMRRYLGISGVVGPRG